MIGNRCHIVAMPPATIADFTTTGPIAGVTRLANLPRFPMREFFSTRKRPRRPLPPPGARRVPIVRRNWRLKCAWSANPQLIAISLRGASLLNISSTARLILRLMR